MLQHYATEAWNKSVQTYYIKDSLYIKGEHKEKHIEKGVEILKLPLEGM